MSILCISKVWAFSKAENSTLLVLLAVADFADDHGYAYPSVETLATKARIDRRTAQRALADLVEMGELEIDRQAGMRGCNLYRMTVSEQTTPTTGGGKNDRGDILTGGGKCDIGGRQKQQEGAAKTTERGGVMPPEPSVNRHEPSVEPSAHKREVVKPKPKPKQAQLAIAETPKADPASDLPATWSPALCQAWADWCQHRRDQRKPITPTAKRHQLAQLAKWPERQAIENIHHAIRSGWQGIYDRPPLGGRRGQPMAEPRPHNPEAEQRLRAF